jgi:hypothetical protein
MHRGRSESARRTGWAPSVNAWSRRGPGGIATIAGASRSTAVPYVWVRIYATNAYTESAPLWLYGMRSLARWLMLEKIELGDLQEIK